MGWLLSTVFVGALGGAAAPALAAEAADLGELVVTASRRGAENIQDVPMAVTALQPKVLEALGLTSLSDFTRLAPSLAMVEQAPGVNTIVIRGLAVRGMDSSEIVDRSLVSVYLDDTPISLKTGTPDLKVVDLEAIEVLRGPQGTLYGAGSMAGTIRLITQKPKFNDFFGYAELTGSVTGHYGSGNGSGKITMNVPVVDDKLALRVSGFHEDMSGYIKDLDSDDIANPSKQTQARIAARWAVTDDLTADLSITYNKIDASLSFAMADLPKYQVINRYKPIADQETTVYALTLGYDLGFADLTSSTAYYTYENMFATDTSFNVWLWSFGNEGEQPRSSFRASNDLKDFVQEFRLSSKGDTRLKWTTGIFYERGKRKQWEDDPTSTLDARYALEVGIPNYSSVTNDLCFTPDNTFCGLQTTLDEQFTVYGEATYELFTGLEVTAGLRYFDWSQRYDAIFTGKNGASPPATADAPIGTPQVVSAKSSADGFTPRFAVQYHVNEDFNVFVEAAKGFRYGGNNQPIPFEYCGADLAAEGLTQAPPSFGPDKLWSYSLGTRNQFLDRRLSFNVTAFQVDWNDVQTTKYLGCSYYYTVNAGKVQSRGLELEGVARVTPELSLSFNASYTDAKSKGAIENLNAPGGTRAPFSPKYIASVTGAYTVPLADAALEISGNISYRGNFVSEFDPTSSSRRTVPSATLLNAAVTYRRAPYEVSVFATNITDSSNITQIDAVSGGTFQPGDKIAYGRPRTVGVRVRASF